MSSNLCEQKKKRLMKLRISHRHLLQSQIPGHVTVTDVLLITCLSFVSVSPTRFSEYYNNVGIRSHLADWPLALEDDVAVIERKQKGEPVFLLMISANKPDVGQERGTR